MQSKRNRRMQCSLQNPDLQKVAGALLDFFLDHDHSGTLLGFARSSWYETRKTKLSQFPVKLEAWRLKKSQTRRQYRRLSMIIVIMWLKPSCQLEKVGKTSWPPHVSKSSIENSRLLLRSLQLRFQSYNSPLRFSLVTGTLIGTAPARRIHYQLF